MVRNNLIELQKIDGHTRATEMGTTIACPNCFDYPRLGYTGTTTVYHFAWSAIKCQHCGKDIEKEQWVKVIFND